MKPTGLFRCFRIAAFLSLCALSQAASAIDIKIGWVGPINTPPTVMPPKNPLALDLQRGAQLAIDEANQRGLNLGGRPLHFTLLSIDDNNNPNFAVNAANSLVRSNVTAVVGHYLTETTLAAAEVYAKADVPQITVFAASPVVTQQGYNTLFQMTGDISRATTYMTSAFSGEHNKKRVAVASNGSLMGSSVADTVERELIKHGNQLAGRVSISPRSSDFNEVIAELNRIKPDVLYFAGIQQQALILSNRLHQYGSPIQLLLSGGAFNPDFYTTAGGWPNGTMIMMHGASEPLQRGYPDFAKAYAAKYGKPPMPYAAKPYDAVNVIVQAILTSGSTDPKTLTKTLHNMSYKGLTGQIAFDKDGRLINPEFALYRVEQNKWKVFRTFP